MTGLATLALPDVPVALQLASFGVWSVITVLIGRRWYTDYPVSTDATLNDPVNRLIGRTVTVEVAIGDGGGRVSIGDGSWPARGAGAEAGAQVRIVAIENGVVVVEPV